MFKCSECGAEFEKKPDYCDCGNNIFDEIKNLKEEKKEETKESKTENSYKKENVKKSFFEQYPTIEKFKDSLDTLSVSIFAICILFSILAWIYIGYGSDEKQNTQKHSKPAVRQTEPKDMPDIDSIWDSTKPAEKKSPNEAEEIPSKVAREVRVIKPFRSENQAEQQVKEPKSIEKTAKPEQLKKTKNIPLNKTSQNDTALDEYKGRLRQALFNRLAVTSIHGSGKCQIEFSLSGSGRLLNRRFSKQSDNTSLNDAVYNMLMSVPQFSTPPSGYKGEKIRLNFFFDNGYYEINY